MHAIIAAGLLMLSPQISATPTVETKANAQPAKKVCKVDAEDDTGSHIRRRVCKTEAEWNGAKSPKKEMPAQESGSSKLSK